jgi:hypothetical protein
VTEAGENISGVTGTCWQVFAIDYILHNTHYQYYNMTRAELKPSGAPGNPRGAMITTPSVPHQDEPCFSGISANHTPEVSTAYCKGFDVAPPTYTS